MRTDVDRYDFCGNIEVKAKNCVFLSLTKVCSEKIRKKLESYFGITCRFKCVKGSVFSGYEH